MSSNIPNYAEKSANPTVAPSSYVQGLRSVVLYYLLVLFLQVVQVLLLENDGVK